MKIFTTQSELAALERCAASFKVKYTARPAGDSGKIFEVVVSHTNDDDITPAFALMLGQQMEFCRMMEERKLEEKARHERAVSQLMAGPSIVLHSQLEDLLP